MDRSRHHRLLDLSLALVAEDFCEATALRVAWQLVMYLKQPGGQSQFSVPIEPVSTTRRMAGLRHHISRNLTDPLTLTDLAEYAHVSERQLTRIFKAELGTTPAAYVESARVEAARNRLETTDDTLERVASACGFGTLGAFRRRLDTTPTEYRSRFRHLVQTRPEEGAVRPMPRADEDGPPATRRAGDGSRAVGIRPASACVLPDRQHTWRDPDAMRDGEPMTDHITAGSPASDTPT